MRKDKIANAGKDKRQTYNKSKVINPTVGSYNDPWVEDKHRDSKKKSESLEATPVKYYVKQKKQEEKKLRST